MDCSIRVRVRADAGGARWIRCPRAKEGNKHRLCGNRDGWQANEMAVQGRTEVLLQLACQQRNLHRGFRSLPLLSKRWLSLTRTVRQGGRIVAAASQLERGRAGKNSYTVNATCATASGRATQTATVRRVGENRYSGSFYNSEYSNSGVIHIVVRGASQSVRFISGNASAAINLSR